MADENPLASLSKEQLDAVLKLVRPLVADQAKPCVVSSSVTYYRITAEFFETFVDSRDLEQPHDAVKAAEFAEVNPLQPWYVIDKANVVLDSRSVTREEYIEWLRR